MRKIYKFFSKVYVTMIHIYGDSHALFSFKNMKLNYKDHHCSSKTMFRIGRDKVIINYNEEDITSQNDLIVLCYGEIDCRCHIKKIIEKGGSEDSVIDDLVNNYFITILTNIKKGKIIIVGVIPPTRQTDYESINGPILHEFPFVGTDGDRVRYTAKVNKKLMELADLYNYIYFDPYSYYTNSDGTLNYDLSDKTVHLKDNRVFLEKFYEIYYSKVLKVI